MKTEIDKLEADYERLNNFLRQISKGYFNEYDVYQSNKTRPDYHPDHTDPDTENDHTFGEEESDPSTPENISVVQKKKRKK